MSNTHNLYVLKEGRRTPKDIIELEWDEERERFDELLKKNGIGLDFSDADEVFIPKDTLKEYLNILEECCPNSGEIYYDLKEYVDRDEYEFYYVIE